MEIVIGFMLGATMIVGALAYSIRNPAQSSLPRSESDQGGWNNTDGSSKGS